MKRVAAALVACVLMVWGAAGLAQDLRLLKAKVPVRSPRWQSVPRSW